MKIILSSVIVDDQDKALRFYTEILGFMKKTDVPAGKYKWLTVVSKDAPDGVELLLEPDVHPAAKTYQKALFDGGIPLTTLGVEDVEKEHERLKALGVVFPMEPTNMGPVTIAIFDDTCGNFIQIAQKNLPTE
jgi:predicted enzyme related to lactoylglutathione lyase